MVYAIDVFNIHASDYAYATSKWKSIIMKIFKLPVPNIIREFAWLLYIAQSVVGSNKHAESGNCQICPLPFLQSAEETLNDVLFSQFSLLLDLGDQTPFLNI